MPLFARLSHIGNPIRRIDLAPELEAELADKFTPIIEAAAASNLTRIPFSNGYNAHDSELTQIANFGPADTIILAADAPISLDPLTDGELGDITTIVFVFPSLADLIGLQSFDSRQLLRRKGLALILSGTTFSKMQGQGLSLADRVDAVVSRSSRSIEFRSLNSMRRMFDMAEHYQEATKEEIFEFAGHAIFDADAAALHSSADTWTRRKISSILKSGVLMQHSAQELVGVASDIGIALDIVADGNGNPRIKIPSSKKEIKIVLKFLDDDFLESLISSNRYETNSKRRFNR